MLRSGPLCAFILAVLAGCGDLTHVPPPPVRLNAIDVPQAAVDGGSPTGAATHATRLIHAAPARALVTLHLPDIAGAVRRFKKTSLHTLLTSREMASVLGPLQVGLGGLSLKAPGIAPGAGGGPNMDKLVKALQGEFVLSLEDITFDESGRPNSARLIAAVSVRGAEREAEQIVEFATMVAASNEAMRIEKGSREGSAFTRILGRDPVPYVLELAVHHGSFLFGVGRESVVAAITRMETDGVGSLGENADFRRAMVRCMGPQDALRIHVDVAKALDRFGGYLPEDARHILEVMGVDKYRSVASAVAFEGKDIVVSTFLDSPGGEDLLTTLLADHPVDRLFLDRIPADASSFSLFAIDGTKVLQRLRERLRADMLEDFEAFLAEVRAGGIDLERDVLEVFGPRCAVVTLPQEVSHAQGLDAIWDHLLGTAFLLEVADRKEAERALAKLAKSADSVQRSEDEIEGTKTVTYRFERGQVPPGFAISYAHVEGYLVVALSEDALRRMLEPRPEGTAEHYREILKEVPETATMLSYDNMQQGVGLLISAFFGGLNASMRRAGGGLDVRPPSFDALLRDFNPAISYTVADKFGIYSKTRSATGGLGGTGGLTGLLVLSSVAIPDFAIARARANEASALQTLRAIHSAEQSYRASRIRDEDRDQVGEYGFLMELMGEPRPSDEEPVGSAKLLSDFVRGEQGDLESRGYCFRVYLPAEDGSPVGEHMKPERLAEVDGDLAESVVVVVAWPKSKTTTGHRAFLMDATGTIYGCDEGPYEGANAPPPDVCNRQQGNLASESQAPNGPAWDGCFWSRVR